MKEQLLKLVELEEPKARLERFLTFLDHRPNYIERKIHNAKKWNVVAVLDSPEFDEGIMERKHIFGGEKMYVNPKYELLTSLKYYIRPDIPLKVKLDFLKSKRESAKRWIIGMNAITKCSSKGIPVSSNGVEE